MKLADGRKIGYCSFVYASNRVQERKPLWRRLSRLSQQINEPWCIMGDFNVVASVEEKITKDGYARAVSEELMEVMVECEISDLRYYDDKYTWTNSHIYCKLDRCLVNHYWRDEHGESYACFMENNVSDHRPCVLHIQD